MRHPLYGALLAPVMVPALAVSGCMVTGESVEIAEMTTDTRTVELGSAREVEVFLDAGIGEFVVRGGAEGLMEADFTYNVAEWRPTVEYEESDGKGTLRIRQPRLRGRNVPGEAENRWDIRLADGVPLRIHMDTGIGSAELDLSGLAVTELDVDQGVGEAVIDVGAEFADDLVLDIDGGVGDLRISVPRGIGVRLDADIGLGSVAAPGFVRSGGSYVNASYGDSEKTVTIRIDAGVGSVTINAPGDGSTSV